jgi:ribosomal protein S25
MRKSVSLRHELFSVQSCRKNASQSGEAEDKKKKETKEKENEKKKTVILEKLIVVQLVKTFLAFMEPEGSL